MISTTYKYFLNLFEDPIWMNVILYIAGCNELTGPATRQELIFDMKIPTHTVDHIVSNLHQLGVIKKNKTPQKNSVDYLFDHNRYNALKFQYNNLNDALHPKNTKTPLDSDQKAIPRHSKSGQSKVLQFQALEKNPTTLSPRQSAVCDVLGGRNHQRR